MEIWKTLRVSHIPTPPTTTTDNCPTRRYTNTPLGTKDRSGDASLWVPPFRKPLAVGKTRDLSLLLASTAITELVGREQLWQDCLQWCNDSSLLPFSVRCITGSGGSGKTRFALELVHHLRSLEGWDARFVRFEKSGAFDLWAKTGGKNHVLLVFDYAADNAGAIAASLRALADNPPANPTRSLRILLLARTANWESGWLTQFKPKNTLEAAQPLSDYFAPQEPIQLAGLTVRDRITVFEQAYHKAAEVLGLPTAKLDPAAFANRHAKETLQDPLALIMAAVVGLRSGVPNALSLTRLELAYEAAELLVEQRLRQAFAENSAVALHLAAYATLSGGIAEKDVLAVQQAESEANNLGRTVNPSEFMERLSSWLPAKSGSGCGVIEPDIVGEAFVLGKCTPRLRNPQATILRAIESRDTKVVQFLIRATQDFCLAEAGSRREPLDWLEMLITRGYGGDFELLQEIDAALPESSVVLRPQSLRIKEKLLELVREFVEKQGVAGLSMELVNALARQLASVSIAQSEVGQREEALQTAQEAVRLRRELARDNRDAFLPDLASSLNNLANLQSEMGQREEALQTAQEALALRRELAQRNRDAFLPNLAGSLNNLAIRQSEMGQREEALQTAQEALKLYRELAQRNRDAFLPNLAKSLNNLANLQSATGQREEALQTAQEALAFQRELAQRNRDAFLPNLAKSLNNLANQQSAVGQREEALHTAQEALALQRELAQRNRDASLPDLARSLYTLAKRQIAVGQREEALRTAQEAVQHYREFAQRNRDAFLPELAVSCGLLGRVSLSAGLNTEATRAFAEGLRLMLAYLPSHPLAPHFNLAIEFLGVYVQAVKESQGEPDEQLLSDASNVLGPYLPQSGESND
jgi:hypothetical protein